MSQSRLISIEPITAEITYDVAVGQGQSPVTVTEIFFSSLGKDDYTVKRHSQSGMPYSVPRAAGTASPPPPVPPATAPS